MCINSYTEFKQIRIKSDIPKGYYVKSTLKGNVILTAKNTFNYKCNIKPNKVENHKMATPKTKILERNLSKRRYMLFKELASCCKKGNFVLYLKKIVKKLLQLIFII